jgi:hypothetical protein
VRVVTDDSEGGIVGASDAFGLDRLAIALLDRRR